MESRGLKHIIVVIIHYHTLLPLTDVAIVFHLTGSGSPHASVLLRVAMNHHHTVSLKGDSEIVRREAR